MSIGAIIVVLFTAFLILISTLVLLKNGRIPVKFAVLWLLVFLVLLLVGCIPNVIMNIAAKLGFKTMSNMLHWSFDCNVVFYVYGTYNYCFWTKDKNYFINTRIIDVKRKN